MVKIDGARFWKLVGQLHSYWKQNSSEFNDSSSLLIANGKNDGVAVFNKTLSIFLWLIGYELYDTAMLITTNAIHILASEKKINLFSDIGVSKDGIFLHLIQLEKKTDPMPKLNTFITAILDKDNTKTIGRIEKDIVKGGPIEKLKAMIDENELLKFVDATIGISSVLAPCDKQEIEDVSIAAKLSCAVLEKKLLEDMEEVLNSGEDRMHSKLAEDTAELFDDESALSKVVSKSIKETVDLTEIESCFHPIIMSGGKYVLKPSATSNDDCLQSGAIIISTGARYKSLCSCVTRTYLIDPDDEQKNVYQLLVEVREAVLTALRPGAKASSVFRAATKLIQKSRPDLIPNFTRNCGFMTGYEFRDGSFMLNTKNERLVPLDSVFIIMMGFGDVSRRSTTEKFAVMLSDTVFVSHGGARNLCLTDSAFKKITYFLDSDEKVSGDDGEVPLSLQVDMDAPRTRGARKSRAATNNIAAVQAEQKRREAQLALAEKKNLQAIQKYSSEQVDCDFDENRPDEKKQILSYESVKKFPKDLRAKRIRVDVSHESILLPICDRMVPLHIKLVKNVMSYEQGENFFLRINLVHPGSAAQNKMLPEQADMNQHFMKELTFRAVDSRNLIRVLRMVKELQKRVKQRELERAARKDYAEQPALIQATQHRFEHKLRDLSIKPSLGGKKIVGFLATHENGLLFKSNKGHSVEIIYSNIKHAFFQPADNTISVVLHFELVNPIKVNNKRTNYIQVYQEVVDASQDLGGSSKRGYYDRDGIQEEQQERLRRNKANEKFRTFARNVEDLVEQLDPESKFEFDIPYKDLAFPGVPDKSNVQVLPTVHGLVALDDNPPFVLSLADVELAYFERVQFSLRNFDLVFVFTDFDRPIVKIRSIPIDSKDAIQQFLTDSDVLYYVGTVSLQWPRILKTIQEDKKYFFTEQGGWQSILGEDDANEGSDDEEDEESAFEIGSDEEDEDDEDSEEYESAEMSDEMSDGEDEEDEDDIGPSWEELEQETIREERRQEQDSDEDRPAKRRRNRQ